MSIITRVGDPDFVRNSTVLDQIYGRVGVKTPSMKWSSQLATAIVIKSIDNTNMKYSD